MVRVEAVRYVVRKSRASVTVACPWTTSAALSGNGDRTRCEGRVDSPRSRLFARPGVASSTTPGRAGWLCSHGRGPGPCWG